MGTADKTRLEGFQYWLVIFNYDAPCNITSTDVPRIQDLVQVTYNRSFLWELTTVYTHVVPAAHAACSACSM